jgi:ribosome-associated heat shock protein Hsp15
VSEAVRIDRWLCSARMFKSRTQATEACVAGHVKLVLPASSGDAEHSTSHSIKASHVVRVGDRLVVDCPRGRLDLEVVALGEKRLAPQLARNLYVDHTPPPEPKDPIFGDRDRGAGRPTKRDRRDIEALRKQLSKQQSGS